MSQCITIKLEAVEGMSADAYPITLHTVEMKFQTYPNNWNPIMFNGPLREAMACFCKSQLQNDVESFRRVAMAMINNNIMSENGICKDVLIGRIS